MKDITQNKIYPNWLALAEVEHLFSILDPEFQNMRFVGGCVRNHLFGKSVTDFDLATSLSPTNVLELLNKAQIKTVPLGLTHGSIMAIIGSCAFEITTLRRDIKTDGRHAVVCYTQSWQEDAARRDFTFNALYLSMTGQLYDPWQGQDDLRCGLVRFIGKAEIRIQEDYLRILRYFRFLAHYGDISVNVSAKAEALMACQRFASSLEKLSVERIQRELIKLLQATNPVPALKAMVDTQVWLFVFKNISPIALKSLQHLIALEQQYQIEPSPERRLALILAQENSQKISWFLKYLKFSRQQSLKIEKIIQTFHRTCKNVFELLYNQGFSTTQNALLLQMACGQNDALWQQLPQFWQKPTFPLTGQDLKKLGLEAGPLWGKVLRHVETWWIQKNFQPSADECWERAEIYVKSL